MYAVVKTGGKQYRVASGDILEVEKLEGNVGDTVALNEVLLVANGDAVAIGQPTVEGAAVTAKITGQHRGKKIMVFRYRPKKRIRVRRGHRQYLTRLEIESIDGGGAVPQAVQAVVQEESEPTLEPTASEEVAELASAVTPAEATAAEEIVESGSSVVDEAAQEAGMVASAAVEDAEVESPVSEAAEEADDESGAPEAQKDEE